jgi:glycosyltransferase involved in cell wall biosynthesis
MEAAQGNGKLGRLLVVSDLVTPTGFSRVAQSLIKHWEQFFDIVGVGVNYHGDPHDYKFPIFPAMTRMARTPYGEDRVCDLLNTNDFDLVWILNDAWVINTYLKAIKEKVQKVLPKIVVYFPVDSLEHNPAWYENFDIVTVPVTYTKFGQWVVNDTNPTLDTRIIPHGVDTDRFFPLFGGDKKEVKNRFFEPYAKTVGDMSESFVVLNANRNQPRKKLDITIKGFAKFAKNKPANVKLYMHTGIVDSSVSLDTLTSRYGMQDRLIISSMKPGIQRVPDSRLNEIYNTCDVGINTSMGEGWGLTNVEHAITGAVQVVPNHSACRELFLDCGMLMKTCGDFMFDNSMTVGKLVSPDEVASRLEFLYNNRVEMNRLAKLGYEKFTSKEYQWSTIANTWLELFSEVLNNASDVSENPS